MSDIHQKEKVAVTEVRPETTAAPLEKHIQPLLLPFERFFAGQASSAFVLFMATVLALYFANSELHTLYDTIVHSKISIAFNEYRIEHDIHYWINDGLMVLFFFLLGLEVKREFVAGELSDIRNASFVFFIAIGGMTFPALMFFITSGLMANQDLSGWAVPVATDTAFALGLLMLLGDRVPRAAAVTLTAMAIVDDIGAVLVIGFFYTADLNFSGLMYAGWVIGAMVLLNLIGVRHFGWYLLGGFLLWICIVISGIHATTAGIITALCVPALPKHPANRTVSKLDRVVRRLKSRETDVPMLEEPKNIQLVEQAKHIAEDAIAPVHQWWMSLHKPIAFVLLPVFAFLNAGIVLPTDDRFQSNWLVMIFDSPLTMATMLGLVVGKVTGIVLLGWIAVRFRFAQLPSELKWMHMVGLGFLAGIGFTMALFIATLAYEGQPSLLADAKLGILLGSLVSGVLGVFALMFAARQK